MGDAAVAAGGDARSRAPDAALADLDELARAVAERRGSCATACPGRAHLTSSPRRSSTRARPPRACARSRRAARRAARRGACERRARRPVRRLRPAAGAAAVRGYAAQHGRHRARARSRARCRCCRASRRPRSPRRATRRASRRCCWRRTSSRPRNVAHVAVDGELIAFNLTRAISTRSSPPRRRRRRVAAGDEPLARQSATRGCSRARRSRPLRPASAPREADVVCLCAAFDAGAEGELDAAVRRSGAGRQPTRRSCVR